MQHDERKSRRPRRRKRRSNYDGALRHWAKEDAAEGDEKEEANVGILVAVAVGLVLALCLYYIFQQMEYAPPI